MHQYLSQPLSFKSLIENKELGRCDIMRSISQNLHLILITRYGESRYHPDYGCAIWDYDFVNIQSNNTWKEEITNSIREAVLKHEPRLTNPVVKTLFGQEEIAYNNKTHIRIKQKLEITIRGNIVVTNEEFYFTKKLLVSPFAMD